MDPQRLIVDGTNFAQQAVFHDQAGNFKLAQFFYIEASEAILKAISLEPSLEELKRKALQYIERGEALHRQINTGSASLQRSSSQSEHEKDGQQIEFILTQAVFEDEQGNY